ncbi:spore cortex biosynthesis protein YabQ [Anaerocolumna sedimenticola]|uniref:Spore cortex biosynthesis protein YabQ n=1 Tax=Anaerocolumna sedimenticola TaxID=2696063 RepID=A0A6P1TKA9_9FIRM|nr:spore cortex biosynthesis protein YabQ [Anaerocolumna sedimenticola]QHQ60491.1 spore cortex biosynthesis protein YabQ [Anaerocolumna sedimenticola]
MNDAIMVELRFFGTSVLWGIILLILYDVLRIFRRVIIHNGFFIAFEDLIYWVVSSLLIFHMMYQQNNGIIRGFAILAMLIGMILYHSVFSELFVNTISTLLNQIINLTWKLFALILRPFRFIFRKIKRLFMWIFSKIKKFIQFLFKSLKKLKKSSKITVSDNEKGD